MANNTPVSFERAPRWAWKVLIAICALIALAGAWMSRSPNDAPATQANRMVYAVSHDNWTTINLPPLNWFTFDTEKPVVIRLANGEEFVNTPDGKLLKNGREVSTVGDVIPGFKLSVRAKDEGPPTHFALSLWPK